MENKWIYIDEITTLHADDDGVCLSNEYNSITFNPHTLVDWLPNIIEVAFQEKEKRDKEKIEELSTKLSDLEQNTIDIALVQRDLTHLNTKIDELHKILIRIENNNK